MLVTQVTSLALALAHVAVAEAAATSNKKTLDLCKAPAAAAGSKRILRICTGGLGLCKAVWEAHFALAALGQSLVVKPAATGRLALALAADMLEVESAALPKSAVAVVAVACYSRRH